jgi:hypothetical protein
MAVIIKGSVKIARPIVPTDIAGLQLWLDASDSTTLFTDSAGTTLATADGDPIGCWKDKSGGNRNATQTDGTQKATIKLAQKNGKNVVRFNATTSKLYGTMSTLFTDSSFVGVCRMNTSDSSWRAVCITGASNESMTAGGRVHGVLKINNSLNQLIVSGWDPSLDGNSSIAVGSNWALFAGKFENTGTNKSYIWVNGAESGGDPKSIATYIEQGYQYRIGRGTPTGELWNGDIGEICIYNSAISNYDRMNLQNYLNNKWGIY